MSLGVQAGDGVIVPSLTFIATANAVKYCGAHPLFVDCESDTWNIDPTLVEAAITPRTKGIIVVHLYGHPVEMDPILAVARRHGLFVVEDAAEAYGAEYKGRKVGSLGDIATFSFYGNKIITTGEGGMVVTNDPALATRVRRLREQGADSQRRYWFPMIGYNYRMTNLAAAIGVAQMEKAGWHMARRFEVAAWYREELRGLPWLSWQVEKEWAKHAYWMFSIVLNEGMRLNRDTLISHLHKQGVETRPIFYPLHILPPYLNNGSRDRLPVAERIGRNGITLPTWAGLTHQDVRYICRKMFDWVRDTRNAGQGLECPGTANDKANKL